MRYMLILSTLLLIAAPALAANEKPTLPQNIVFDYECRQIDPSITGFKCYFDRHGVIFLWKKHLKEMPPENRERAQYEFNKIALRYLELGGYTFWIRFADWPKNKLEKCYRWKSHDYTYTCDAPYVMEDSPSGN